ncbi:MBL fold metallo-hydrolase [Halobaculum magnesiiphilum]|uniref:MBL fold metallo-hydrolase n=1 Tax=Halobaculum magnesiiphilum TaxID=1017351 RepID=A0A8T8WEN8_9EURY|nr:MBL fold metallo-hydrolase [Halobaculum magnesiiphilum]QZP38291.1 MBL fold metallo-hydrolase [Halobaculum magnesiiphilum]
MPREIAPGLHWIYEAGPDRTESWDLADREPEWYEEGREAYVPQCAYLVDGGDETLLFDTLSPASTDEILAAIDELVGDRGLDYLVVSHPDVPHAGNALAILEEHPETTLVAPGYGNDHELYRLDYGVHVTEGDEIDLGNRTVEFHEATFLDAPVSVWMTERETGTLFPVDWMGFTHLDDERLVFVDELDGEFDSSRLVEFHGRVLFWYQYVDVEKTNAEIDALIEKFDPEIVAPAHGLVIREDATDYMELMKDVTRTIDEQGRVGTLG